MLNHVNPTLRLQQYNWMTWPSALQNMDTLGRLLLQLLILTSWGRRTSRTKYFPLSTQVVAGSSNGCTFPWVESSTTHPQMLGHWPHSLTAQRWKSILLLTAMWLSLDSWLTNRSAKGPQWTIELQLLLVIWLTTIGFCIIWLIDCLFDLQIFWDMIANNDLKVCVCGQ